MKNKKLSKRMILSITAGILLLAGIAVLLYPTVTKKINSAKTDNVVKDFDDFVENLNVTATWDESLISTFDEANVDDIASNKGEINSSFTPQQANRLYRDLYLYNIDLYENGQSAYGDPFVFADSSIDLNSYGIDDGLIGVLVAPDISLNLPIYLGASEHNMEKGAAQLNRTSMPIGGKNTNCVIAGHRGMISQTMFDNIVNLKVGDSVSVKNYWETLNYKVRETKIIDPMDTNQLLIEEGKDILTLITCHPYGSNAKRYLVICERVVP